MTIEEKRRELLGDKWYNVMESEFNQQYMDNIREYINSEINRGVTIYPSPSDFFKAYKLCPFDQVRCVILGQDPYPNGEANGLAFGIGGDYGATPSIKNIWNELEEDIQFGLYLEEDTSLEKWAKQGVFLLNTVLSVQKGRSGSHKGIGWERFTGNTLLKLVADDRPKVFMLWGKDAQEMFDKVMNKHYTLDIPHLVLEAPHPVADMYKKDKFGDVIPDYPRTFRGCKHFSKCNEFLDSKARLTIRW